MNNGYNYDSKEKTGYVGLINAGNTCYMNSFLQTLFNLSSFTRCVLRMPIKEDENTSMQAALQQVFYNLKYSNKAVATNELLVFSQKLIIFIKFINFFFKKLLKLEILWLGKQGSMGPTRRSGI